VSASPVVSSLATLNTAFAGAFATYVAKTLGLELAQAGLSSVDDLDTDMHILKKRSPDPMVEKLPGMVTSRTQIAPMLAQRVDEDKFIAQVDGKDLKVDYRLVTCKYSSRIYVQDIYEAERLVDQIILLHSPAFTFTYEMPGVTTDGVPLFATARLDPLTLRNTYVTQAQREKAGEFFQIRVETDVRALLVSLPRRAALIKEIFFTIYDKGVIEGSLGQDFENINPHETDEPYLGQIRIL
jgi:hypothetical protein